MNCVLSKGLPFASYLKCGMLRNTLLSCNAPFFVGINASEPFSHSSICQTWKTPPGSVARRKALEIVDWLPFEWRRRPKHNAFEDSCDLVKELEYDPSWPKPDFELSEELKTASDDIKHMYSLATATKAEIKEVVKRRILERVQRHPNDLDSLEVQIALRTITIRSVFQHQRELQKERVGGRLALDIMIKKRNRLLKNLYRMDTERFNWLCDELKLKYTPKQLGGIRERYTRKWDLRRLTKEYCTKLIKEKKAAYHEELKQQQIDFLKEKEETLAWIEKEEKELANLNIDK